MTDYHALWQAIVIAFGIVPFLVGAGVGAFWAWRTRQRGWRLVLPALAGGAVLGLAVFAATILFLRF